MASIYSEDIGFIKATMIAMKDDMGEMKDVQVAQQGCIDTLVADQVYRKQLRVAIKGLFFVVVALVTIRFGDLYKLLF